MSERATFTDKCVVLDLDRTLFRTDDFFHDALNVLVERGIFSQRMCKEFSDRIAALRGRDVDWVVIAGQATGHSSDEISREVHDSLISHDTSVYFYDGVAELLTELKDSTTPFVIMTKGGQMTQQLKLDILTKTFADHVPAFITDTEAKAIWIENHISPAEEGYYYLPAAFNYPNTLVKKIYIFDDKLQHIQSESEAIVGVHIDNSSKRVNGALAIAAVSSLLVEV